MLPPLFAALNADSAFARHAAIATPPIIAAMPFRQLSRWLRDIAAMPLPLAVAMPIASRYARALPQRVIYATLMMISPLPAYTAMPIHMLHIAAAGDMLLPPPRCRRYATFRRFDAAAYHAAMPPLPPY